MVLSLIALPIKAQWILMPTPNQEILKDIVFLNENTGIVVGFSGVILKTTNAGSTWVTKNTLPSSILGSVCYLGNQTLIAVGVSGKILRSTDLGETWLNITSPVSTHLLCLNFINDLTGYACGADVTIIKTTDAGLTWQIKNNSPGSGTYLSCHFFNELTGLVARSSPDIIARTTNGGLNWTTVLSTSPSTGTAFAFANATTGVVMTDGGSIYKTTNAGINWAITQVGTSSYGLYAGCFINDNIGYVVGKKSGLPTGGVIIKTGNRGDNWTTEATFNDELWGFACNSAYLYAVGQNGSIYRTVNPVGIIPIGTTVPSEYVLSQNYPNPFNPTTNIEFLIPKNGVVKLQVFDMMGREVSTLVDQNLVAGKYKVDFNGSNLSSGTYFYKLTAEGYREVKKMVLMK